MNLFQLFLESLKNSNVESVDHPILLIYFNMISGDCVITRFSIFFISRDLTLSWGKGKSVNFWALFSTFIVINNMVIIIIIKIHKRRNILFPYKYIRYKLGTIFL